MLLLSKIFSVSSQKDHFTLSLSRVKRNQKHLFQSTCIWTEELLRIVLLLKSSSFFSLSSFFLSTSYSAYEDKKHSKRKEISFRSWFNSTSATPGGAAGSLLHKLGLQGKEAAVAKALGSSHSPLIRKRTGSTGIKSEPCATVTRRKSDPEVHTYDSTVTQTKEGLNTAVTSTQAGQEVAETNDSVKITEELDKGVMNKEEEKEKEQDRSRVTSLVADYSDSDSDPGQWGCSVWKS